MTSKMEIEADSMAGSIRAHWREYLMEACCLGMFMIAACVFAVLLEHPAARVHQAIESPFTRRLLMGQADPRRAKSRATARASQCRRVD